MLKEATKHARKGNYLSADYYEQMKKSLTPEIAKLIKVLPFFFFLFPFFRMQLLISFAKIQIIYQCIMFLLKKLKLIDSFFFFFIKKSYKIIFNYIKLKKYKKSKYLIIEVFKFYIF